MSSLENVTMTGEIDSENREHEGDGENEGFVGKRATEWTK